ncbi:hypothetical protein L195_g030792 [Trifolium pratense]|uniref:Uncharacterized protein n=1 Tax=Trifolium pratense TaxID=57577 RepID=A0A2K3L8L9_TRIPR|nr:hypothetical protein L195_g030792 [Trifolium pratense]
MATQIHEGCHFGFARLILANLYEALGTASDELKAKNGASFLCYRTRLIQLTPPVWQDPKKVFMKYMKLFLSLDQFKPRFAPFVKREIGLAWFREAFPTTDPRHEERVNEIWRAYLDTNVLSYKVGPTSSDTGLVGYQPNLVSR